MRRAALALAFTLVLGASPSLAQDAPAPPAEDPAVVESTLRGLIDDAAGDERRDLVRRLAQHLETQWQWLPAASLWRELRRADGHADDAMGEGRALLGFAEDVLRSGGMGGGIRAAFEDARLALGRAKEMGAASVDVEIGLARCAAAQGDPDRQIAVLDAAAERWPKEAQISRQRAFAYQNAGQFERAVELFQGLVEATPDEVLLHRALSYSARMAGDEETAVSAAGQAIALAPKTGAPWKSLWDVFAGGRRFGELTDAMTPLAERFPASAPGAYYTGYAAQYARRFDLSLTWLRRAWENDGTYHAARIAAASILRFEKRDREGAAALYRDVLAAQPDDMQAISGLADIAVRLGDERKHAEAIPYFAEVANALPDDGRVHANLALALRWTGSYDKAVAAYEQAVEASPDDAQIRNDFGLLLLVMKNDERATEVFKAANEVDPLHNDGLENLGFMARERGDMSAAREWFEMAWKAAIDRDHEGQIARHRRNADDVRWPLPPLR